MKRSLSVVLAALLAVSLAGCGKSGGSDATTAAAGGAQPGTEAAAAGSEAAGTGDSSEKNYREHLTIAFESQITEMDPQGNGNANEIHAKLFSMTHDTLFKYNVETGELEPNLATEWDWLDDACTKLHVKLRDDVTFQNGNPLTAEDVAFTLDRVSSDTQITNYYDHTEIQGDHELTIVLKTGNVDFVYILSRPFDSIVNKAAVEADPDFGATIGTGAWINDLDGYVAGDTIELKRNDNYWGEVPKTKSITLVYIANSSSRLMALESDEVQLIYKLASTEIDMAKGNSKIEVKEFPTTRLYYFAFNTAAGPGTDVNLRKAVAYAINKEDLIAAVGDTGAMVAESFYGSAMAYLTTEFDEKITYDVEKAKEYVAKCGGNTSLKLMANTGDGIFKTMSEVLQEQFRQVGITLEIEEVDSAGISANTKYASATHESMIYSIGTNTWDSDMGRLFSVGTNSNKAIVDDSRISELLIEGSACVDPEQRASYYKEIQAINNDQCYYVPLYYSSTTIAYTAGLEGIVINPTGYFDYSHICLPE
ncbi:MAG: ABC transporter substrate-binding protein [Lachnospiraceae bacterium]|nr:ABC transporter substrate-binding protein [Lachnospiraceae bacterium]